jgi:serine phosphatase RsbU (regulator of sigma subunit)
LILKALDKGVKESLNQEETANNDGMDIAICTIDTKSKKMEFAGAKNPLVYIQNGEVIEVVGDKLHIGGSMRKNIEKFKNKQFTKHTIDLSLPTTCYIFSDGYEDQFGGTENKKFGKRQLYRKFLEYHQLSIEAQKLALERDLKAWMGKHAQIDDILVIGFRV